MHPVYQPPDRDRGEREEDREAEPLNEADLRIGNVEVGLDLVDQQAD